ncbi:MAG: ribosomal RNA small subunit methyltransferase A [Chloroflexi bacterium]|nr:ribosomal RNA small subunit methyltransferase A [Chloroflexota bacterium]
MRPSKSLGQHFLTDPVHLHRIVAAAELGAADTVLEVGPGPGNLTRLLCAAVPQGRVIAVELDSRMISYLQEHLTDSANLELLHADILQLDIAQLLGQAPAEAGQAGTGFPPSFKVVANLPYYITSAVLRHLLEATRRPERLVVLVQREVAQRICAAPGEMSILAVSVQVFGAPRLIARVPPGAFVPPPKVESAILRIDVYPQPLVAEPELPFFFRVVRAGFGEKRKQLRNSLAHGLDLPPAVGETLLRAADIDPQRRAETLTLAEWQALTQHFQQLNLKG